MTAHGRDDRLPRQAAEQNSAMTIPQPPGPVPPMPEPIPPVPEPMPSPEPLPPVDPEPQPQMAREPGAASPDPAVSTPPIDTASEVRWAGESPAEAEHEEQTGEMPGDEEVVVADLPAPQEPPD